MLEVDEDVVEDKMDSNFIHGNPKQPRFNMFDSFEYPASLTLNGEREITSFSGGCCCLLMFMLIAIIANFEVGIYLSRSDTRVGMSTEIMQPLSTESNSTFNSKLTF